MPSSNNPYDLIHALEKRYNELLNDSDIAASSDITATEDITAANEEFDEAVICYAEDLVEYHIITEDDIQTLIDLDMFNMRTLDRLLKKRTGYDDITDYENDMYDGEEE